MKYTIYTHLTCPTSYTLLKKLLETEIDIDRKVTLIDTAYNPLEAIYRKIISVPSIVDENQTLIYSGVFNIDEAIETITKNKKPELEEISYDDAADTVIQGLIDSYLTALWLYLHDDIEKVMVNREFIEAVSRLVFLKNRKGDEYSKLTKETVKRYKELYEYYRAILAEVVARNIVREAVWITKDLDIEAPESMPYTLQELTHIVLSRSSIGRIGLTPAYRDSEIYARIKHLYQKLEEDWSKILAKVEKEYEKILTDREYLNHYLEKAIPKNKQNKYRKQNNK